jgi:hypothetical protein
MSVSISETPRRAEAKVPTARRTSLPRWFADYHGVMAVVLYAIVIVAYERYPIEHLASACSCQNSDPSQWMWTWKWFIYAFGHGLNPLFTNEIWPGRPFDLAAVTLAPTTAILGVPLSVLFGPLVAFNLLAFASPVLSGWAAYRLCRYISGAPYASILAGYTYGFSAYELGHLLGHLNLLPVFVPPMLLLLVLRYVNGEVTRRRMIISGLILLLLQFGLSTEVLFDMSYVGAFTFIVAFIFAPAERRRLIEVAILLVIAYALMAAICSYYIYWQIHGPQESGGAAAGYPADLLSSFFPTPTFHFGANKFAGLAASFNTGDPYEQNSYLGAPLIGIMLAFAFSSWRRGGTKIIVISSLFTFVMSLGVYLIVAGKQFFELPYGWFAHHFSFFNEAFPSRLGLFVGLGGALATALWISWARGRVNTMWRWFVGLLAVALLLPSPGLPGRINSQAQPAFFTSDIYKRYVKPKEIVMTIPFSQGGDEMLWQADTDFYFRLAGGYLGFEPPQYAAIPIVYYQLYGGSSIPMPLATGVSELRSFVATHHVGVVLVQVAQEQNWPLALRAGHFRLKAVTGGMAVWQLPRDLS